MAKNHFVASLKGSISKRKTENISLLEKEFHLEEVWLFNGKAEEFVEKIDNIALTVTSPPYNVGLNYSTYDDSKNWDEYLEWLSEIFYKIYTKTLPGGRLILNVPYMVKFGRNKRKLVQKDYEDVLLKSEFNIEDLIVWVKAKSENELKGVLGRSTAWGSWLSPSKPNMRPVHELLIVGKKPGKLESITKPDITAEEFKLWTSSVWLIPSSFDPYHPAVFPEELVYRSVKLWSYEGQLIFDPFMGVGTVGKVAVRTKRKFAGSEVDSSYFIQAIRRIINVDNQASQRGLFNI